MVLGIHKTYGKTLLFFNTDDIKKCFIEKNYNTFAEFVEITSSFAANRCCDFVPSISDFKKIANVSPDGSILFFYIENGEFIYNIITIDGFEKRIIPEKQLSGYEDDFDERYNNEIRLLKEYFPDTYYGIDNY